MSNVQVSVKDIKHSYARLRGDVIHVSVSAHIPAEARPAMIDRMVRRIEKATRGLPTQHDVLRSTCQRGEFCFATGHSGILAAHSIPEREKALRAYARKHVLPDLEREVRNWHVLVAPQCALTEVRISTAKGRWGSCTSTGVIRISLRTLLLPYHLFAYVVLHEVIHLSHMHHGPVFWNALANFMPDYTKRVKELHHYV